MTSKKLSVFLNKIFTGTFEQNSNNGSLSFYYDADYLKTPKSKPLSLALPLRVEPFDNITTRNFFSGLLPDNDQLTLVARQLKLSEQNPFAILSEIGRDCAGAIEILPSGEKPPTYKQGKIEKLTEDQLCKILENIRISPLLTGARKIRLSLAGAQSKLAVFFDEKKNSQPALVMGKPSTHILKPTMLNLPDSVHNEFFCMKLAKAAEFKVAEVFLKYAKDRPYLLIRRYDRAKEKGLITRIHQEDFCQALGLPPESKYQGPDGGPGIKTCLDLISKNSAYPGLDTLSFINTVIFNYLIGNSDAHGKNFSFLYQKNNTSLAPLYDLVCTAAYKTIHQEMAMKIGKSYEPDRITGINWSSIVPNARSSQDWLFNQLKKYAKELPNKALELKKSLEKQNISSPVFDDIINIIYKRSARILKMY